LYRTPWSRKNFSIYGLSRTKKGLLFGLIFGLLGGLIVGLIFGLNDGLNDGLIDGLIGGLIDGLLGGLIGGLIGFISAGWGEVIPKSTTLPNEGIKNTIKSIKKGLIVVLILVLIGGTEGLTG
jgi:hypothetical protein